MYCYTAKAKTEIDTSKQGAAEQKYITCGIRFGTRKQEEARKAVNKLLVNTR